MNKHFSSRRLLLFSAARFILIFTFSMVIATIVNYGTYKDFQSKSLFKLHTTDLTALANQMTIKLNFFLSNGDKEGIQSVLDSSFGLFGFVVTDCIEANKLCPDQKILFTSDISLPWAYLPEKNDLSSASFAFLRRLPVLPSGGENAVSDSVATGDVIGRLYVINNMPKSFTEAFLSGIKSPFTDVGARRFYLRTSLTFLAGALIIWTFVELYFVVRRKKLFILLQRELELKQSVNRQMKELTEKDVEIMRLHDQSGRQYEDYVSKIRSLNLVISNEEEYREFAEQIIADLERDKARESEKYTDQLSAVRMDMERLQQKVIQYEHGAKKTPEESYRSLEEAVRTPQFSNVFEQRVFEVLSSATKYKSGEWRVLSNFDVAPGRNYRQFTDFILFNKDALIILEAKYYVGLIDSPGDFKNDIWVSSSGQKKKIDCLWGENPYHQLNEYSMSLMKIIKQKNSWYFQIFGVIIFPDEADISKIGEHLGKFYRITTVSNAVALFESIFAEAARFQAAKNPQRPTPVQVEEILRGRKLSTSR